jgi:preprotein translocase subunit SecF
MLPVKWDGGLQAKVAENLGFDPESPMIKMEIASIVSRGIGGTSYLGVPFGYKESVLEQQSGRDWQNGAEKIESNAATGSPAGESVVGDSVGGDVCSPLRAMAMVAVGMAALVIIVGIVVLLRPKRI